MNEWMNEMIWPFHLPIVDVIRADNDWEKFANNDNIDIVSFQFDIFDPNDPSNDG